MRREPWKEGKYLELPTHEIHASSPDQDSPELEILLNESSGDQWIFRRNQAITRRLSVIGAISDGGIPYLCPEIVLLYKARNPPPDDEADFYRSYKKLGCNHQRWLLNSIEICYPNHPWLMLLYG